MGEHQNPSEDLQNLRADYLDLIENSLIGRLNQDPAMYSDEDSDEDSDNDSTDEEPSLTETGRYRETYRARGWDWPLTAPSMIGHARMTNLRRECERVLSENIAGDFLEAGVWRGGACIMMRAVLNAYQIKDRKVFAADSFAGTPPPDQSIEADASAEFHTFEDFVVPLEEVKANFKRYGLLDNQVVFLKGPFQQTLPEAPVTQLALLRLDGDTWQSSMETLTSLYDKLNVGGTLIVDDYNLFESQQQAVDQYRETHNITDKIIPIDDWGVYWIKT